MTRDGRGAARWLTRAIGSQPVANPELLQEWRQLAAAIADYRETRNVDHPTLPLGRESDDPAQAALARRIWTFRDLRGLGMGLEL
jgi:hypothetical protein